MNENLDVYRIHDLAKAIPSTVPKVEGEDKFNGWGHGACRRASLPEDRSVGFYRQAVRNKYTGEVKYFVVSIPLDFCGEVEPGQSIDVAKGIPDEATPEEIDDMARESFLKLQEIITEFYNREAA